MFSNVAKLLERLKRRRGPQPVKVLADENAVRVVLDHGKPSLAFLWAEVTEIRTFKVDLITTDDIRLAFQASGHWHTFSEDLDGFPQLAEIMRDVFPSIPEDWFGEVMLPPFATNERVLFRSKIAG